MLSRKYSEMLLENLSGAGDAVRVSSETLVPAHFPVAQTNLTEKDPARYDAEWWRSTGVVPGCRA